MSYCRFSTDSDIYLIATGDGRGHPRWECMVCLLAPEGRGYVTATRAAMYRHLLDHRKHGHKVPESALDRLAQEISEE